MADNSFEDDKKNEEEQPESAAEPKDDSAKSAISADLIRGHINTIILRTLDERDKYGYEIMNEIEEKSHGQYTLKQPTLYSALKRLETQGYIKAYWKTDEVSSGGRRKYFTLTELGREYSEKNQSEWEYSRTVIDSLISDRSFDFSQPAPTAVDFNLLKKSVTRVYTGGGKDGEDSEEAAESDDIQSKLSNKYSAIENAPVKDEYTISTASDVCDVVVGKTDEENKDGNGAQQSDKESPAHESAAENASQDEPAAAERSAGGQQDIAQGQNPASTAETSYAGEQHYAGQPDGVAQSAQPPYIDGQPPFAQQQNAAYAQQNTAEQYQYGYGAYPPAAQPYPGQYAQQPAYDRQTYIRQQYAAPAYAPFAEQPYPAQQFEQPYMPSEDQPTAQHAQTTQSGYSTIGGDPAKGGLFADFAEQKAEEDRRSAEEKRIAHENYLKLIAEQDEKERGIVPNSDEIDTQKLLYTNKPETERDYKKLVNNIFNKAVKHEEFVPNAPVEQPVRQGAAEAAPRAAEPEMQPSETAAQNGYYAARISDDPAYEKAKADGLKISTSTASYTRKSVKSTNFNKGGALFACSVIVGIIMLIEFTVCISLMQPLNIGIMYPMTLLILAAVQLGVFGALYLYGYGKGSVRPATHSYISLCIVLTVIAILMICLVSFLLDINFQSSVDIAVKIIIPSITALNITIFGVSYYFISR